MTRPGIPTLSTMAVAASYTFNVPEEAGAEPVPPYVVDASQASQNNLVVAMKLMIYQMMATKTTELEEKIRVIVEKGRVVKQELADLVHELEIEWSDEKVEEKKAAIRSLAAKEKSLCMYTTSSGYATSTNTITGAAMLIDRLAAEQERALSKQQLEKNIAAEKLRERLAVLYSRHAAAQKELKEHCEQAGLISELLL